MLTYPLEAPTKKQRKAAIKAGVANLERLAGLAKERPLSPDERQAFDRSEEAVKAHMAALDAERNMHGPKAARNIEGRANEPVPAGHMRTWYERASRNGVKVITDEGQIDIGRQGHDRDLNRYWAERMGLAGPSIETRALLEDTAGSAQAITPQAWQADYVDVLLPNTFLGKVGANVVPMSQETVHVPVFSSTVSPSWIAEAGSISLDANPAFSDLPLFATGGFKDITLYSIEAAQDAYVKGNLSGMLAQAMAAKMAVVLDTSAILGVTSNTGIPGLNNESGFVKRHYTGDAGTTGKTPTDTTELGVVAELAVKANVPADQLAFVSNVGCNQAFQRLPLSTYGRYWDMPPIVAQNNIPWVTSENSAFPYVETDPATASSVAQTGGTMTSLYCGPWSRFAYVGMRLDLTTQVLKERYADSGQIGLFSYCRYSIRYAHPETFSRTVGILPV